MTQAIAFNLDALEWGPPVLVETPKGQRRRRDCRIMGVWADRLAIMARDGKLKAEGYTIARVGGAWTLHEWRTPEGKLPIDAPVSAQASLVALAAHYRPHLTRAQVEDEIGALMAKLYDYQREPAFILALCLNRFGGALDASEMGTGKTYCAVAASIIIQRPLFVVCPKQVIKPWKEVAAHFGINLAGAINYEMVRQGKTPYLAFEERMFRNRPLKDYKWKLPARTIVALDEGHYCKNPSTDNCKMAVRAWLQKYPVLVISGTLADNPSQMKLPGLVGGLFERPENFFPWAKRHKVVSTSLGYRYMGDNRLLQTIRNKLFPTRGVRIRIKDLGDKFPETQIKAEAYDCGKEAGAIETIYKEMEEEIAEIRASEARDKSNNAQARILVAKLRARQLTEILKVPLITGLAENAIGEGMNVAIFVNFDATIFALADRLNAKLFIRGGQTINERAWMIDTFQRDEEPLILVNVKAGGAGIGLHGTDNSRTRYAIICPTDSAVDLKQVFHRVWRKDGARSVQRVVYAADTIEESICRNVRTKISRIDTLNDGDLEPPRAF